MTAIRPRILQANDICFLSRKRIFRNNAAAYRFYVNVFGRRNSAQKRLDIKYYVSVRSSIRSIFKRKAVNFCQPLLDDADLKIAKYTFRHTAKIRSALSMAHISARLQFVASEILASDDKIEFFACGIFNGIVMPKGNFVFAGIGSKGKPSAVLRYHKTALFRRNHIGIRQERRRRYDIIAVIGKISETAFKAHRGLFHFCQKRLFIRTYFAKLFLLGRVDFFNFVSKKHYWRIKACGKFVYVRYVH